MGSNKDITDEEYERIKKHIKEYLYTDLIIWRNDMINSGSIYNRLYDLIQHEIVRRNTERYEKNQAGKSK